MTSFKVLGAIAMLSAVSATPVFAQAAIQEPGNYAFYHPNGEPGVTRPASDAMASIGDTGRVRSITMSHPRLARRAQAGKPY
jgi:hypothetical protein